MEVVRGGTAVLRSEFIDYQGAAIDTTMQTLKIYRPNDVLYRTVPATDITRLAAGLYRYNFYVPSSADDGVWRLEWTALHPNSTVLIGEEELTVLLVDEASLNTVPSLRLLINEKIPLFGEQEDTRFTDNELALILERMGGSLYAAASEAWYVKAGMFELLIDIDESGSNRSLEQVFKHAVAMGDRYSRAFKTEGDALSNAIEGRVPGIAVSPWLTEVEPNPLFLYEGYAGYSRYFPIARFVYNPSVMS